MMSRVHNHRVPWLLFISCLVHGAGAKADVLLGVNGERFVGTVVEEKADAVVFESEIGGRMTVPRSRIRELQRTPKAPEPGTNATASAQSAVTSSATWQPPGVGKDGFDWLQLKSDEW